MGSVLRLPLFCEFFFIAGCTADGGCFSRHLNSITILLLRMKKFNNLIFQSQDCAARQFQCSLLDGVTEKDTIFTHFFCNHLHKGK